MENAMQIFKNDEFGQVRTVVSITSHILLEKMLLISLDIKMGVGI